MFDGAEELLDQTSVFEAIKVVFQGKAGIAEV